MPRNERVIRCDDKPATDFFKVMAADIAGVCVAIGASEENAGGRTNLALFASRKSVNAVIQAIKEIRDVQFPRKKEPEPVKEIKDSGTFPKSFQKLLIDDDCETHLHVALGKERIQISFEDAEAWGKTLIAIARQKKEAWENGT